MSIKSVRDWGLSLLVTMMLLSSLGLAPGVVHAAATYYVATNGTTSNPGTFSQPFANINQFMSVALPGDTVLVRGGTYSIGETYLSKSGTASGGNITIKNYPGEAPILDGGGSSGVAFYFGEGNQGAGKGSYITIEGFIIRNYWRSGINIGCCEVNGAHQTVSNVTIRNNVVDRMGQNGITLMNAANVTVENNLVGRTGWDAGTGSWSSGINLYQIYGSNNVVRNNVTYHNIDVSGYHTDGNGIIVDLSYYNGSARIENNLAFENGGAGIIMTHSAGGTIINNTLYENGKEPTYVNGGTGLGFYGTEGTNGMTVKNNIVYQSFGNGLYTSQSMTNSTFANNNIAGQSGYSDPAFTDANNADFRLQSSSSSIDTGTSSGAPSDSIGFDKNALLKTTLNQPVSWYRYAPDFAYIEGKGEVKNLFASVSRPQGGGYDKGAFESTATGGGTGGPGTNLISNGEFDNGTNGWWTYFDASASGTIAATTSAGLSGTNALKFDLSNGGDADWKAQLGQTVSSLSSGTTYTLSFKGKADSARSITVSVSQEGSPYSTFLSQTASLTASGQTYSYTFTPNASGNVYVKFNVGGGSADVYLDQISLTSGSGTASNLVANGGFESGTLDSWSSWGGTQQAAAAAKYSGNYGLSSSGNGIAQTITVEPNTTYVLTAMGKAVTGYMNIGITNYGGTEISRQVSSSSWAAITPITFTTGSSATTAQVYVWEPQGNTGYADDFKVVKQ
ncbi:carbohydrate binding domain-containing protein [Paenibacillus glycanilyticus]|uniref:carbohydrate binding domain-containing protein n=1 Tax=Paenibacillus glycanilyticus TaxID=126569 RepID=UPI000FDB9AEC|nr:carbohydrate binding domain-containing protein [Paenibacillus glycanilyticus]